MIPLSGAFEAGPHRLMLTLSRKRWPTTDTVDDLNTYADEATIQFTL